MKIQLSKTPPATDRISLEGDLDFHSSAELRQEFSKLADQQSKNILIDLEKVGYVDSSGLAAFVEIFQKIKRYGGKLALVNLKPSVRSVFEISKLDTLFKLASNEQEAIAYFG